MRKLPKPTYDLKYHLDSCISHCRTNKTEMQNFTNDIIERANSYDNKATIDELFTFERLSNIPFDANSLINLYTTHMSKKGSIGRDIYDKLILSAKGRCPFCASGIPTTIDHFLSKDVENGFPELSIVPINLVPCCKDCNHMKSNKIPAAQDEQFIHPYYDDVNNDKWLYAKVSYEISNEPVLIFYVSCPSDWDDTLKARIQNQFKLLNLNSTYSQQAANELSGILYSLKELFINGGENAVKEYLIREANSREQANKNSWQTAMYYALAEDNNICSMLL